MSRIQRTKKQVQAGLHLDAPPDDGFMRLLEEVGDEDVVSGPALSATAGVYTPAAIEETVIAETVGSLLARARSESERSLRDIGRGIGVTGTRVQQIERSANLEIATFVRCAKACGYHVSISLNPVGGDQRTLSVVL